MLKNTIKEIGNTHVSDGNSLRQPSEVDAAGERNCTVRAAAKKEFQARKKV